MGNNTKTKTKILSTATFIVSALFNVACNNLLSLTEAGQHKTRTNDNLALRIHMKNVKVACPQLRPANALIKKHRVHDYLSIQDVQPDFLIEGRIPSKTYHKKIYEDDKTAKENELANTKRYNEFLKAIETINALPRGKTFYILINSPGGSTDTTLKLIQAMRKAKQNNDVKFIIYAKKASSAASLILSEGTHGMRITEDRNYIIHAGRKRYPGKTDSPHDDYIKFATDYIKEGMTTTADLITEHNNWVRAVYQLNSNTQISEDCLQIMVQDYVDTPLNGANVLHAGISDISYNNGTISVRPDFNYNNFNHIYSTFERRRNNPVKLANINVTP